MYTIGSSSNNGVDLLGQLREVDSGWGLPREVSGCWWAR